MTLLLGMALGVVRQMLSRPGDGEALPVKQPLDLQHVFDILAAVEAVPGFAFGGFERRKLGLPKSQDIGLCMRQLAHLTDAEIKLVRDEDLGKQGVGGAVGACTAGSRHSKPQAMVEGQLQAILENCAGSVKEKGIGNGESPNGDLKPPPHQTVLATQYPGACASLHL